MCKLPRLPASMPVKCWTGPREVSLQRFDFGFGDVMRSGYFLLFLVLTASALVSCSSYKMDIRQGNYVTADMRGKLALGLSKQQVKYVLGTPMINDAFHANRWDYVYLLERAGKLVEEQRLTLYFKGENLERIEDTAPFKAAVATGNQNNVKN